MRVTEGFASVLSNVRVWGRNTDHISSRKRLLVSKIHSWVLLWFYSTLLWD